MQRHPVTLPPLASLTGSPPVDDGGHPSYRQGPAGPMQHQRLPSSSSWESFARPRTTSGSIYTGDVAPAYQQQQVQQSSVASRSPPPPMSYPREQGQTDHYAPTAASSSSSNWPHPSYQHPPPLPPSAPPAAAPYQRQPSASMTTAAGRMRSYSRPEPYHMSSIEGTRPATSGPGVGPSQGFGGGGGQHYQPYPGHVSSFPISDGYEVRASTGMPTEGRRESDESANSGSSGSKRNRSESASGVTGPAGGPGSGDVLQGFSKVQDGRRYELVVIQSPSRARMCGFGDKDRRPLSPTLIVRLVVTDTATNQVVPPQEIDTSGFFLAADLVHPEDLKSVPRNLLVHQHASTISTELIHPSIDYPDSATAAIPHQHAAAPTPMTSTFDVDRIRSRSLSDPWRAAQVTPSWYENPPSSGPLVLTAAQQPTQFTTVTTETYTRNFVGASVASANVLKDESEQVGIFFILQDLSVRTEGLYRIKLIFTDLSMSNSSPTDEEEAIVPPTTIADGPSEGAGTNGNGTDGGEDLEEDKDAATSTQANGKDKSSTSSPPSTAATGSTTTIKAPTVCGALAGIYTDPFTVYTPRRFPGVIEPTTLSKKFAAQGVKIPVRVDRKKRRRGEGDRGVIGEEDDEDDYGDEY